MRIQEYSTYEAYLNLTIASPRPEGAPSHIIPSAKLHDQLASQVRGILREYKHTGLTEGVAATATIATYFPQQNSKPIYRILALVPAGSITDSDQELLFDGMRMRYAVTFCILPGALSASESLAFAFEENFQRAFQSLLVAQGMTDIFIPGDEDRRPGDRTEIDVMLELGGGSARLGYDVS